MFGRAAQAEPNIDPNIVRPGWTPLLITGCCWWRWCCLFLSMRKQLRKIHVPDDDRRAAEDRRTPTAVGTGAGAEPDQAPERDREARTSRPIALR